MAVNNQGISESLTVCDHPLLEQNMSIIRDRNTPHELFRIAIRRVAQLVFLEATRSLMLTKTFVETPICKTETHVLSPEIPIIITPILRAGLVMSDIALDWLPEASVYHVGLYRNEETLKPITYYNKLPSTIDYSQARIFILDPMLATGGSAVAAVEIISKLGVQHENISFVSIIAAPEGVQNLLNHYPDICIFTGALDERLNDKAYIVPGLGDAGDRSFGTI